MPLDMSAAKAPPKKRTPSTRTATAPVRKEEPQANTGHVDRREAGLNGLAQLGQGVLLLLGQHADAATVGMHWPPISHELALVAESNEKIAKPIDLLIEIGPYGALASALLPFVMQIAANHRWIDASKMPGQVLPPEVLEARMQTKMMEAAAEAKRKQNEALAEARRAQAEFEAAMRESDG